MKRILAAIVGTLALGTLGGCYATVSPYSYPSGYATGGVYYGTPVYSTGYAAPVYRPVPRVYGAPRMAPAYRPVVSVPHHRRYW